MDKIRQWTQANKMMLNTKKTNAMIFNFSKQNQFTTRIKVEEETIEIVTQTKLLGVLVNNKLLWEDNTKYVIQKANSRMRLLHKLASFSVPVV